jgi:hypothetical protein
MPSSAWNRPVCRAWAPVYDVLLERFLRPGRQAAARVLDLQPGERVLRNEPSLLGGQYRVALLTRGDDPRS